MTYRQRIAQLMRSGVSGAAGSVFDFGSMVVLVELLRLAYAPAAALASAVGAVACFLFNRRFAFRERGPVSRRQLAAFGVVAAGAMAINAVVVHLLAGLLSVAYLLAKLASAVLVFITWTYPTQSRLVFADRRES